MDFKCPKCQQKEGYCECDIKNSYCGKYNINVCKNYCLDNPDGECSLEKAKPESDVRAECYDLSHSNTMIVAKNRTEHFYIIEYCDINDILPPYIGIPDKFPIALSVNGGGWTYHMDRALYYVPFVEFVKIVSSHIDSKEG